MRDRIPGGRGIYVGTGLSDDKYIPGLKALADAVHAAGSKLYVQSTQHGKDARVDVANDCPVLAPNNAGYT